MSILYRVEYLRNFASRNISYSTMFNIINRLLHTRYGFRSACETAQPLLTFLDERKIRHNPSETAVRMVMLRTLFPWAYCRFAAHPEELEQWVDVSGMDQIVPLLNSNKGILFASNHHGPGHLVDFFLANRGYPVNVIQAGHHVHRKHMRFASPAINKHIKKIFTKQDASPSLMKTTISIRELLRQGETVVAALDGGQGGSTFKIKLMDNEREFRYALPLVASLSNASIVPVFSSLGINGRIKLLFGSPLPDPAKNQSPLEYARNIMNMYVVMLQKHMENEPGNIKMRMLSRT